MLYHWKVSVFLYLYISHAQSVKTLKTMRKYVFICHKNLGDYERSCRCSLRYTEGRAWQQGDHEQLKPGTNQTPGIYLQENLRANINEWTKKKEEETAGISWEDARRAMSNEEDRPGKKLTSMCGLLQRQAW